MCLLGHALSRAGDALHCIGAARDDHGAGYARSIIRFAELYGRRLYSIAEIEMQDLLNPAITNGEPLLIEGNVTWDPAYEGPVGGEIPAAVRVDRARQPASTRLRPVAAR